MELEFQISSLKSENKRVREECERRMDIFGGEKEAEIEGLRNKIDTLAEQGVKDKGKI